MVTDPAGNGAYVRAMFAAIAPRYDRANRVLTAGAGEAWRRRALGGLAAPHGGRVADLCCGTGDLAFHLVPPPIRGRELPRCDDGVLADFVAALRAGYDPRTQRGIVHFFTETAREARVFAGEFGSVLGIGGVVTFKTAQALRDAVREVGLDAIVLEVAA